MPKGTRKKSCFFLTSYTLPEINIAPENWWLGDYFPFWNGLFSGVNVRVAKNKNFMPEKQAQNPQTPRSENYNMSSSIPQVDGALPRIFTLLPVNWQSWPCAKVPRGLVRTGGFFRTGCRETLGFCMD